MNEAHGQSQPASKALYWATAVPSAKRRSGKEPATRHEDPEELADSRFGEQRGGADWVAPDPDTRAHTRCGSVSRQGAAPFPLSASRPIAGTTTLQRTIKRLKRELTKAKRNHQINRQVQRGGHPGRKAWRSAPATAPQLSALRKIAMNTGRTFRVSLSRGQAWRRIKPAVATLSEAERRECSPPWSSLRKHRRNGTQ